MTCSSSKKCRRLQISPFDSTVERSVCGLCTWGNFQLLKINLLWHNKSIVLSSIFMASAITIPHALLVRWTVTLQHIQHHESEILDCCFNCFINSLSLTILIPIIYLYGKEFGLNDFQTSVLFAFTLSPVLATPIIGKLSDRFGRKPLL